MRGDMKTRCGILIKQICDSIAKVSNNELREKDLTLSQLRYLGYIYESSAKKVPFKELEAYFDVAQPTVVGILRRLEQKGLVKAEQSDTDMRAKTVCITEKGKAVYEESEVRRNEMEEMLLVSLNEDERLQFEEFLQRVFFEMKNI